MSVLGLSAASITPSRDLGPAQWSFGMWHPDLEAALGAGSAALQRGLDFSGVTLAPGASAWPDPSATATPGPTPVAATPVAYDGYPPSTGATATPTPTYSGYPPSTGATATPTPNSGYPPSAGATATPSSGYPPSTGATATPTPYSPVILPPQELPQRRLSYLRPREAPRPRPCATRCGLLTRPSRAGA